MPDSGRRVGGFRQAREKIFSQRERPLSMASKPRSKDRSARREKKKVCTQAFLFDADAEGVPSYYGGHFVEPFLEGLAAADPCGTTSSRIMRGDVLVRAL